MATKKGYTIQEAKALCRVVVDEEVKTLRKNLRMQNGKTFASLTV
ncbi:MAG: hypothetical protein PHN60_03040 [Candidatus Gracilibacteria bacterium]|nr:hypothetical protein [Candidatus Gracilibacteria bacterium]